MTARFREEMFMGDFENVQPGLIPGFATWPPSLWILHIYIEFSQWTDLGVSVSLRTFTLALVNVKVSLHLLPSGLFFGVAIAENTIMDASYDLETVRQHAAGRQSPNRDSQAERQGKNCSRPSTTQYSSHSPNAISFTRSAVSRRLLNDQSFFTEVPQLLTFLSYALGCGLPWIQNQGTRSESTNRLQPNRQWSGGSPSSEKIILIRPNGTHLPGIDPFPPLPWLWKNPSKIEWDRIPTDP